MRPLISTSAESGMTVQRYAAMPDSRIDERMLVEADP